MYKLIFNNLYNEREVFFNGYIILDDRFIYFYCSEYSNFTNWNDI